MAENTKIEWCDHTFNPWIGCTKVSPACAHCYAEARSKRVGEPELWQGARRRTTVENWNKPFRWDNEAHPTFGRNARVFCASLADVFDNVVDPRWRADLFTLMHNTPRLDWLLLTKRIGNASAMITDALYDGHLLSGRATPWPWSNVWLGATVANQEEAERDIPKLLATPARIRFLSIEPMLGPIDLRRLEVNGGWLDCLTGRLRAREPQAIGRRYFDDRVDWVIVGGESGGGARATDRRWISGIVDQCTRGRVPVFVKQLGAFVQDRNDAGFEGLEGEWPEGTTFTPMTHRQWQGDEVRIRLKDRKGGNPQEWPEELRVRKHPTTG